MGKINMSQKLLDSSFISNQKAPSFLSRNQTTRAFIFQFIGTLLFYMGFVCTVYKNPVQTKQFNTKMMHDVYISLSLYTSIIFFTPLSDGYFNPAISLAMFFNKESQQKIKLNKLFSHWIGQFLAIGFGCFFFKFLYDCGQGPFKTDHIYTARDIFDYSVEQQNFINLGTFFFVLFILIVTTQKTTFIHEQCWIHLFISIIYYGGRKLSKTVGLLNPFILIGTQTITFISNDYKQPEHLLYSLFLSGAQLLAAFISSIFFKFIFCRNLSKWRSQ